MALPRRKPNFRNRKLTFVEPRSMAQFDPEMTLTSRRARNMPYARLEHTRCDDASRRQRFETDAAAHTLAQFPVRDRTPR